MAEDYECGNCGFTADAESFPPAKDLSERFVPGDTYTDSECPHCGALAFPVEEKTTRSESDKREMVKYILWDYLKKDPEHKDRRKTGWGTKTLEGLYLSLDTVFNDDK